MTTIVGPPHPDRAPVPYAVHRRPDGRVALYSLHGATLHATPEAALRYATERSGPGGVTLYALGELDDVVEDR